MESFAISPRSFIEREEIIDEFRDNEVVSLMVDFIKNSKTGIASFS